MTSDDQPTTPVGLRPETAVICAGRPGHATGGPLNVPVVLASNFHSGAGIGEDSRAYSRTDATPGWEALETAVGQVEGGHAVAFSSGMAAIAAVLWRGKLGGQAVLVAGTEPPDVTELWDWTLGPGESHSTEAHAAGTRELLLVLDGQVKLTVGQHAEVLATGDSASFSGDLPHGYANPSSARPARFALTVFEPAVGGGAAR